jgi:hypothetical protein
MKHLAYFWLVSTLTDQVLKHFWFRVPKKKCLNKAYVRIELSTKRKHFYDLTKLY